MPQKLLRLGYTECTLLFIYWLHKYKQFTNKDLDNKKIDKINWLYTTSGYYDITVKSELFKVVHSPENTEIYNKYMEQLLNFIKDCDHFNCCIHLEKDAVNLDNQINEFKTVINQKNTNSTHIFKFIENKKILIISPFSPLMKSQLENGNCKRIYPNTPTIDTIYTYKFPYTFFNSGPHNNILETTDYVYNEIINTIPDDYDSVILSCGAYSCILGEKFYNYGKNIYLGGGELQPAFGILNTRYKLHTSMMDSLKEYYTESTKQYWIENIPDEYKPKDYKKIENGCYW